MSSAPWYLWVLVALGVGLILLATVRAFWTSARAVGVGNGAAWRASALFGGGYLAWIAVTAVLGCCHVYRFERDAVKPWLAVGFAVPLVALLLLARLPFVRRLMSDPRALSRFTRPHEVRVVGVIFLIAMALGEVPAAFALPAGLGDIAIGLAAAGVARGLLGSGGRRRAVWFNVLGLVDFVVAFAIGFLGAPGNTQLLQLTPNTEQISVLPLVLIPTAAVPLLFVLHVISLAGLRTARAGTAVPARPAAVL